MEAPSEFRLNSSVDRHCYSSASLQGMPYSTKCGCRTKFTTTVPELLVLISELKLLVGVAKKDLALIWMARALRGMIKKATTNEL